MKHLWAMMAVSAVILTAKAVAETLTIGGVTYYDMRWGAVTPATVSIIHARGIETVPLGKLPEDLQRRFHYDPTRAASYRAQEEARETARLTQFNQAEQQRQVAVEEAVERAAQQRRARAEWVQRNTVVMEGKRVERSQLTTLTGFLVKPNEAFLENGKPYTGALLELAKPKGKLPANALYQLRPGLWESAGEVVFLKRYITDLEPGLLLQIQVLESGTVRGLRAFVVVPETQQEKQESTEENGGVNAAVQ